MVKETVENKFPILVVEDQPESRRLLERTLTRSGHEVSCVVNGREALEVFQRRFFPIVLTDWVMPEMDGLQLCRAMRQDPPSAYVFILLLTANGSTREIVEGLEAGADDYLTKPFQPAELLARINTGKRIIELERSLKRVNEEIKLLSITDPLTGAYNRGYLTEQMPKEISRARRYQHPLSVILCDIDNFKGINDTYGHEAGNRIIKAFVERISQFIRQGSDWVVRYGGEEFLVVAPETDVSGGMAMAERIRSEVAEMVVEFDGKGVQITASFGVASFEPRATGQSVNLEALVNLADQFLYQCKQEGRNRVKGGFL